MKSMIISIVLSIISLFLSMINLIYLFVTNRKNLDMIINSYTILHLNDRIYFIFNIELINKSRLPISINEMVIENDNNKYKISKTPNIFMKAKVTSGDIISDRKNASTAIFPINLSGLTSIQKFIFMYGDNDKKLNDINVVINTNRGKIVKEVNFNSCYLKINDFCKEMEKYCI